MGVPRSELRSRSRNVDCRGGRETTSTSCPRRRSRSAYVAMTRTPPERSARARTKVIFSFRFSMIMRTQYEDGLGLRSGVGVGRGVRAGLRVRLGRRDRVFLSLNPNL